MVHSRLFARLCTLQPAIMPKQKQKKEEKDVFKLEEEHHEKKPEKIDLGDTTSLKRALDEAVIEVRPARGPIAPMTRSPLAGGAAGACRLPVKRDIG